jgi:TolB-like protein
VPIGQRGSALLLALLRRTNDLVPKEELMEAGWPGLAVEESNLSVQIATLRRALADGADGAAMIQTVPRRGYRFVGAVERQEPPLQRAAPGEGGRATIAVLPFENIGGDPAQAYFSDGLTRELIGALSKQTALFVIAANSSFHYRGSALDAAQIASALGVRYLLEGGVQRVGARVRVSARLLDAKTGNHLWADRYDRDIIDALALQDEVAREIVGRTGSQVIHAERERIARKPPAAWQAYDLFLKASDPSRRWHRETALALEAMAERAIALDPEFAPAHALLARLSVNAWNIPIQPERFLQPATLERAHRQAWTALSLDPSLPDGHAILGWVLMWRGEIDQATASFARAFELNPNLVDYTYGQFLIIAGRVPEALDALKRVTRYDPLNAPICQAMFGHAYFMLGEDRTALRFLRECASRAPDFWAGHVWLAATCARLGRTEEARHAAAEVLRIVPDFTIAMWRAMHPYQDMDAAETLFRWLGEAGLPA